MKMRRNCVAFSSTEQISNYVTLPVISVEEYIALVQLHPSLKLLLCLTQDAFLDF